MDDDTIPPLTRPEDLPPVRTQDDLHRVWRMLMGPLGFGRRSLWLLVLDADGRATPALAQFEDLPLLPGYRDRAGLADLCRHLVGGGGSVAFLLSRPGRSPITVGEQRWAQALAEVVRSAGLRAWPVHRANDETLVVVAPDDLAASA